MAGHEADRARAIGLEASKARRGRLAGRKEGDRAQVFGLRWAVRGGARWWPGGRSAQGGGRDKVGSRMHGAGGRIAARRGGGGGGRGEGWREQAAGTGWAAECWAGS